jgi:CHAD domain-containing protein
MAFRLKPDEQVSKGLRRLARKQLGNAVKSVERRGGDREKAIHDARRSVKKARAIVEVFESDCSRGLGKVRKRLRRVSRSLSELRDADIKVETLDALHLRAPRALPPATFMLMRRLLRQDRDALLRDPKLRERLNKAAKILKETRRATVKWRSRHKNLRALIAAVKAARRDGRAAMKRAEDSHTAADFHEWRKAVKTLMYELRLVEEAGPEIRAEIRALRYIERWLGVDHNVAVLWDRLIHDDRLSRSWSDVAPLQEASGRYQQELRQKALERGARVYATPPASAAVLRRRWREWQEKA